MLTLLILCINILSLAYYPESLNINNYTPVPVLYSTTQYNTTYCVTAQCCTTQVQLHTVVIRSTVSFFSFMNSAPPSKMAGTYFISKVGSIALSEVQKHFCTISGSRDMSKSKLDIRLQKIYVKENLVS